MALKPISKVNVKNKTLLLRVDLNSNVVNGRIQLAERIRAHAKTIKLLLRKGAKIVVLSHQGRKGEKDFVSLKEHSKALSKLVGKKISFFDWNSDYLNAISSLKKGQILLLENTRFLEFEAEEKSPEEHSKNSIIKQLASKADYYVLDSLSVAHRSHATVVGFIPLLSSFVGPVLEEELLNLNKVISLNVHPKLLVLGGVKLSDSIGIISFFLSQGKADKVLAGGALGELFLKASSYDLGGKEKFFRDNNLNQLLPRAKEILSPFRSKILMPSDIALDVLGSRKELSIQDLPSKYWCKDIGQKTIIEFSREIKEAKLIVFNGPMGVFEEKNFFQGTKAILQSIASSKAFSFLGGGDTLAAIEKLKLNKKKYSYISLSGKASLDFLSGKELPALKALK